MKKKHFFLSICVLMLGCISLSGCTPPLQTPTEGKLTGRVMMPEPDRNSQSRGQPLTKALVDLVDLQTGEVTASAWTGVDGWYSVTAPPGPRSLIRASKETIRIYQISPPIEAGREYDLGEANATTTACALIFLEMVNRGASPETINPAEIAEHPDLPGIIRSIETVLAAGGDPFAASEVQEMVHEFLDPPQPAPTPRPTPRPRPTPQPAPTPTCPTCPVRKGAAPSAREVWPEGG